MSQNHSSTQVDDTEIVYDKITKDFAIKVGGQVIAYAANYHEAEQKRTEYLRERMEDGLMLMPEGDVLDTDGMRVSVEDFRAELRQAVNEAFEPLHTLLASWSTGVAR